VIKLTIYSGKDATVYLGDYELPRVFSFSIKESRRNLTYQDYKGSIYKYKSKPIPTGSINVYNQGLPYLLHFMPYYTIVSTKLVSKWDDELISIGFPFPDECDTYATVYNGSPTTIDFDIPADFIGDDITFKTIHLYVDGVGTPNSAIYTVNLREDTTVRDSETFTWTTNSGRWISLTTIDYTATSNTNWNIQITTSDAGTSSGNCQRVYKLASTEYPFFDTDTGCCILEIEDVLKNNFNIDVTLEVSTNYKAVITGLKWSDFTNSFGVGELSMVEIPYTAESVEWTQL
jgi:hypothetical protein